jgi:hypothetical protein
MKRKIVGVNKFSILCFELKYISGTIRRQRCGGHLTSDVNGTHYICIMKCPVPLPLFSLTGKCILCEKCNIAKMPNPKMKGTAIWYLKRLLLNLNFLTF